MKHVFYIATCCEDLNRLASVKLNDFNTSEKEARMEALELAGTQQKTYYVHEIALYFEGDEIKFKGRLILSVETPIQTPMNGEYKCFF